MPNTETTQLIVEKGAWHRAPNTLRSLSWQTKGLVVLSLGGEKLLFDHSMFMGTY